MDKPHISEHDATADNQDNASFLPVRRIFVGVEENAPKGPQDHRPDVHGEQGHAPHRIVAAALKNDVGPPENERIYHVSRAGQVESEECAGVVEGRNKKHRTDHDLEENGENRHRDPLPGQVHVPRSKHIRCNPGGLNPEWVRVDLRLGEVFAIMLQVQQEVRLEWKSLNGGADRRPQA